MDFDDTLADDSTTQLLKSKGVNPEEFWTEHKARVESDGRCPTLDYMQMLLQLAQPEGPLEGLTNGELRKFGGSLKIYDGVLELLKELKGFCAKHPVSKPDVQFFVLSGGLHEIIAGSKIEPILTGYQGCEFGADSEGVISSIKKVVSFTEKTRYLFEINKGILRKRDKDDPPNPYSVNDPVDQADRPIPFGNMIYVRDGLTDIPCFSLVTEKGGNRFGIFDPKKKGSSERAYGNLLIPKTRQIPVYLPQFGSDDDLGALLRFAVEERLMHLDLVKTSMRRP